MTFGDFFDALRAFSDDQDWSEACVLMDELARMDGPDVWKEVKAAAFDQKLATFLASEMLWMFRRRIEGICTDELYTLVLREAHIFLDELGRRAALAGFDVSPITTRGITLTDILVRASALAPREGPEGGGA